MNCLKKDIKTYLILNSLKAVFVVHHEHMLDISNKTGTDMISGLISIVFLTQYMNAISIILILIQAVKIHEPQTNFKNKTILDMHGTKQKTYRWLTARLQYLQ